MAHSLEIVIVKSETFRNLLLKLDSKFVIPEPDDFLENIWEDMTQKLTQERLTQKILPVIYHSDGIFVRDENEIVLITVDKFKTFCDRVVTEATELFNCKISVVMYDDFLKETVPTTVDSDNDLKYACVKDLSTFFTEIKKIENYNLYSEKIESISKMCSSLSLGQGLNLIISSVNTQDIPNTGQVKELLKDYINCFTVGTVFLDPDLKLKVLEECSILEQNYVQRCLYDFRPYCVPFEGSDQIAYYDEKAKHFQFAFDDLRSGKIKNSIGFWRIVRSYAPELSKYSESLLYVPTVLQKMELNKYYGLKLKAQRDNSDIFKNNMTYLYLKEESITK